VLLKYLITGAPLVGPGDNATFWHRATVDYRARPYVKLTGPRWQRLARRHAVLTLPWPLLCLGWKVAVGYLALLLLAVSGWGVLRAITYLRTRRHHRTWVDPASRVACEVLGIRYTRRAGRAMVVLPRPWPGEERAVARLEFPAGTALTKSLKDKVTSNVGARLGIPAPVTAEWFEQGPSPFVLLSTAPTPPREVTWEGMAKAVREADPETVLAGRKPGGGLVTASLTEDSPHFALSGASGAGKSVLARVLLAPRVAYHGDGLLITDPKKFSHWRWAGDGKVAKDRIRYAWRVEDLHAAWVEVAAELARRIELDEDELAGQRRVWILVEEANTQTKKLTRWWRGERKRIVAETKMRLADDPYADVDLGDLDPPVQSPAIVAMQEAVSMGRELKMHVVVCAQRLSASVFGGNGGDIRESFQGGRFIAKWDRKLWKMLVDTIAYVACPAGPRGIWGLATGDGFTVLRVPFLSEKTALDMVTDKACPVFGPVLGQQAGQGQVDSTRGTGQRELVQAVTLAMALDMLPGQDGPQALSMSGLRTAAGRPGFPCPLDKPDGTPYARTEARLYSLASLVEWREGSEPIGDQVGAVPV
jgi:hypothetical protein